MSKQQIIEDKIAAGKLDQAIGMLTLCIAEDSECSLWHYLLGKVYWRMSRRGEAITEYEKAVALDPNSPAKVALEMSREIMNFYNKDLLNP